MYKYVETGSHRQYQPNKYDVTRQCVTTSTSSSSHGIFFLSVAMATTDHKFSRFVAFFHADERPIFSGFISYSIAHSQVWLGLPIGRFHSEGSKYPRTTTTGNVKLDCVTQERIVKTLKISGEVCHVKHDNMESL